MELQYEVIPEAQAELCRDLCNELMAFQKSKASIAPERFDSMNRSEEHTSELQSHS